MLKVVGTMFFNNRKLLIDKPRKRPTYQMVGGKVEEGERPLEAAIRESAMRNLETRLYSMKNYLN